MIFNLIWRCLLVVMSVLCCQPDAHFNRYTCGVDDDDVMDDETGEIFKFVRLGVH